MSAGELGFLECCFKTESGASDKVGTFGMIAGSYTEGGRGDSEAEMLNSYKNRGKTMELCFQTQAGPEALLQLSRFWFSLTPVSAVSLFFPLYLRRMCRIAAWAGSGTEGKEVGVCGAAEQGRGPSRPMFCTTSPPGDPLTGCGRTSHGTFSLRIWGKGTGTFTDQKPTNASV